MKPVVKYEESSFELHESHGGTYAKVYTYDHPRLGQEWVRTSLVLRDLDDARSRRMSDVRTHSCPSRG